MKNPVLAIDPGLTGAFVLTDGKRLKTWPMPVKVNGKEKSVHFDGVHALLWEVMDGYGTPHVFLERAVAFGQGAKMAFNYGRGFEALLIAIELLKFPMTLVEPSKWAKEMHEGILADLKPKVKSRMAVERLFPHLVRQLPKNKKGVFQDGPIDALLIAGYALRKTAPSLQKKSEDFDFA